MTLAVDYFEQLYVRSRDPWGMRTRWYEERKRGITRAVLPRPCYDCAFEVGCSIGELSAVLAPLCLSYLAWEKEELAYAAAVARLVNVPHARVERADVRQRWPSEMFDLIILSEVGYYFDEQALAHMVARCRQSLRPSGTILGCHWRHPIEGCPLSGDRAQAVIGEASGLTSWVHHVEDDFRLDVWCGDHGSVALDEGLL